MKLNPTKCVFGVLLGKFIDFMVSQWGIEVNPEKVKVILDMTFPKAVKEVQMLIGWITSLNRFVSKATEMCLFFFKTLKQALWWTDECETAFQNLKEYLAKLPFLSPFVEREDLFLYLAILQIVVSSALIREESRIQWPIYYTS